MHKSTYIINTIYFCVIKLTKKLLKQKNYLIDKPVNVYRGSRSGRCVNYISFNQYYVIAWTIKCCNFAFYSVY